MDQPDREYVKGIDETASDFMAGLDRGVPDSTLTMALVAHALDTGNRALLDRLFERTQDLMEPEETWQARHFLIHTALSVISTPVGTARVVPEDRPSLP